MATTTATRRLPSTIWHAFLSSLRANQGARANAPAIVSPPQNIAWTYQEVATKVRGLSQGLAETGGVKKGDIVMVDLPNVAEGLVVQLACARLGAAVGTAKGPDKLPVDEFQCRVVADATNSWLAHNSDCPILVAGESLMQEMLQGDGDHDSAMDDDDKNNNGDLPLGYFGSPKPLTQSQAIRQGQDMKEHFQMVESDLSCVSITLYHPFGIGSACASAWLTGSTIVLPAVGGLHGCGVPSQRAKATLDTLASEHCTLLFADTHTLKALHDESLASELVKAQLSLRGGVCKTGSGSTILDDTVDLAGVTLSTLGKKS